MTRPTALLLALTLGACGGQRIRVPEDQRGDTPDTGGEEGSADGSGSGAPEDEVSAEDIELGDAVTLPGTGVTLRPPSGATRLPFAAGFIDRARRLQLSIVVARGPEELLETMRAGGAPSAPTPEEVRRVTVGGQEGRLGYDRVRTPQAELERAWLLVHDGERALGVIATYEAEAAERVRPSMMEVLESVRWDRDVTLDAAAALGLAFGPVDGLEASHATTASLVYLGTGASYPPSPGDITVTVAPLPLRIPPEQVEEACPRLMDRLVQVDAGDVEHEGTVDDGRLPGCERLATVSGPDGALVAAYVALVFHEGTPIVVQATAAAEELETWQPRFFAATRSVRLVE